MILHPLKDGKTELKVTFQGQTKIIPIEVQRASTDRPISFNLDVMPVFMKAGCNTGSCHGSARGQDRFMLSLFGYDSKGDHFRITREEGTRRINLAIPEESLLVEKAIEAVPHTGGKIIREKQQALANTGRLAEGRCSARLRGHCKARSDRVISTGRPLWKAPVPLSK